MRTTIRYFGWVATAALALHSSAEQTQAQQYYAPATANSQWSAPAHNSYPTTAASSWGSPAAHLYQSSSSGPAARTASAFGGSPATGYTTPLPACTPTYLGQQSACGPVYAAPCASRCGWFGGVGALAITRDRENFFAFSYDTNDESEQLVSNRDAEMDWAGGIESRIGRYFGCGSHSLEFVTWSVLPGAQSYSLLGADVVGDLNAIHNWDQLDYNGAAANNFVDDAVVHRIQRDFEMHNYELNWNSYLNPNPGGSWQVQTIAGLRYFHFGETLDFGADTVDASFTGTVDEIHYNVDVENKLAGAQIGSRSEYHVSQRLAFTAKALAGIYLNDASQRSRIGGAAGYAVVNNGPNVGQEFDITSSKTDLAMMGELDVGLLYRWGSRWQVGAGYRLVGISGVALPTNQIYHDLRGLEDVAWVDVNGDLMLHGGYLQLLYNY